MPGGLSLPLVLLLVAWLVAKVAVHLGCSMQRYCLATLSIHADMRAMT